MSSSTLLSTSTDGRLTSADLRPQSIRPSATSSAKSTKPTLAFDGNSALATRKASVSTMPRRHVTMRTNQSRVMILQRGCNDVHYCQHIQLFVGFGLAESMVGTNLVSKE